jgi:hypothetical protein
MQSLATLSVAGFFVRGLRNGFFLEMFGSYFTDNEMKLL